jgi:hypothetical protein
MTKKEKKNQQHGGAAVDFPFTLLIQNTAFKKEKRAYYSIAREAKPFSQSKRILITSNY